MRRAVLSSVCVGLLSSALAQPAYALAWSSRIVAKGQPASNQPNWPKGFVDFVNDPLRTEGWESGFSEWPNDVSHYGYRAKNTEELNSLIQKFSAIDAKVLEIRLAPAKEPRHYGWVGVLPEGNHWVALLSIGDQEVIKQWYDRLKPDKQFGAHKVSRMPVAVPPMLTIYVQNEAVDLNKLRIPDRVHVVLGHANPPLFHKGFTDEKIPENPRTPSEEDETTKSIKKFLEQCQQNGKTSE